MSKSTTKTMKAYSKLEQICERISILNSASGILGWDFQVMLAPGSSTIRGRQLAELGVLTHEMFASDKVGKLLDKIDVTHLNAWQSANIRETKREYLHATAVPSDLVSALAQATAACEQVWREARQQSNFKMLVPTLKEVLNLNRQFAQAKSEKLGVSRYDALLDTYDPGMTQVKVDSYFGYLQSVLPSLIREVVEHQKKRPAIIPLPEVSVESQKNLGRKLAQMVGFDFTKGRMDVSTHPFCGGGIDDVRITTRYNTKDPISAIMGVVHESGHAVYEQNKPNDWKFQSVGSARGMGIHESQSLIIEMQACRTNQFVNHLSKMMADEFCLVGERDPDTLEPNYIEAYDSYNLHRIITKVEPGFIRVEADEVTYPAHVIVRYNVERDLINEVIEIEDLPDAFNSGIRNLLGLEVPNDRLGCLQDIHWPSGAWGYFPSYTIGAMTAAQLFRTIVESDVSVLSHLAVGDFAPLRKWLNTNIHNNGSFYTADELLVQASGQSLDPSIFIDHLRTRYLWGI